MVEDEDVVRHVVVEVLHQLGYTALEAGDGEAGLAALKANEATHLLISDIGLPGMNGRALADASRELRPGLQVLLMTGYAADASAPGGFAAGMQLLTKPFTVEALAGRLQKMLGNCRTDATSWVVAAASLRCLRKILAERCNAVVEASLPGASPSRR